MADNNQIRTQEKLIRFEDVREKIILGLKSHKIDIEEPVILIDGFLNQPFNMELTNAIMIGGPTIPMIMLLGKESGRIYLFALKAIIKLEDLHESEK